MSADAKKKKSALGMGLDALLPDGLQGDYFLCPIERIFPSRSQPRKVFPQDSIEELATSIAENGLIQPVVVRKLAGEDGYELIAGERRWRASQKAGLTEIPAILRNAESGDVLTLALVENVQREDLNPVDESRAYKLLMDTTGMTQEEVSAKVGKSRAAVANSLRLLALPPEVLESLRGGEITPGHARAVLSAPDERRVKLLRDIIAKGSSVRDAERMAKAPPPKKKTTSRDPDRKALEDRLSKTMGTKVRITGGSKKGGGVLAIHFRNLDDLDRILEMIDR